MPFRTFSMGQFHKSKHGKTLSVTYVVYMGRLVYKVFCSKGRDVSPSDNVHILILMCVKNCQGGQPLLAHMVLRRGVFNLFIPLKLHSAAQADTGYARISKEIGTKCIRLSGMLRDL